MMVAQQSLSNFTAGVTMIDYEVFGRLRFLDWFPVNEVYSCGAPASECAIGHATAEGYGFTYFARKEVAPETTGELCLDFGDDCPEEQGNALLTFLGLNVVKGMSEEAAEGALGAPVSRVVSPSGHVFCRYAIGEIDRYNVSCTFADAAGLLHILICRKDLADQIGSPERK